MNDNLIIEFLSPKKVRGDINDKYLKSPENNWEHYLEGDNVKKLTKYMYDYDAGTWSPNKQKYKINIHHARYIVSILRKIKSGELPESTKWSDLCQSQGSFD